MEIVLIDVQNEKAVYSLLARPSISVFDQFITLILQLTNDDLAEANNLRLIYRAIEQGSKQAIACSGRQDSWRTSVTSRAASSGPAVLHVHHAVHVLICEPGKLGTAAACRA
jgi:hypothetical protein